MKGIWRFRMIVFIKASIMCLILSSTFGCVTYLTYATKVSVIGSVRSLETGSNISGALVTIENSYLLGLGKHEIIAHSDEEGKINGQYKKKWCFKKTSIGIWRTKCPNLTVKILITKEGFYPAELTHEQDDDQNLNNINIDLGIIELKTVD